MFQDAERPENFPACDSVREGLHSARHGRYLIFFLNKGEKTA